MEMTPEREEVIDKMMELVSDEYAKFRERVGEIAIEHGENPYHVLMSTLMAGLEDTKEKFDKAERTAVACCIKVQKMAEETGMPEELLLAILNNNPDMLKAFVIGTHKGLE